MDRFPRGLALALVVFGLVGCGSRVPLRQVWVDEDFDGGYIRSTLVLGISESAADRRFFETEVARVFREGGVRAVVASKVIPGEVPPDREKLRAAVRERDLDAVMVTAVVGERERTEVAPATTTTYLAPNQQDWYGQYYRTYERVQQSEVVTTTRIFRVETAIYDVATEELIWSAYYDADESETVETASAPLGRAILADLVRVGLVLRQ